MTIPLQFASLYDGQVFVWSDCPLDLGMDFLVGNMVFVNMQTTHHKSSESRQCTDINGCILMFHDNRRRN